MGGKRSRATVVESELHFVGILLVLVTRAGQLNVPTRTRSMGVQATVKQL
jgi:hypothetical protein